MENPTKRTARKRRSCFQSLRLSQGSSLFRFVFSMEQLNNEKPLVRRAAVVALMKIGSPKAREALQQASNDEDWEVRVYATEALKHFESAMKERPKE